MPHLRHTLVVKKINYLIIKCKNSLSKPPKDNLLSKLTCFRWLWVRSSKSYWCLTSPEEHKAPKDINEQMKCKKQKSTPVIYLRSWETYFSWRTIRALWRKGWMKDSCVLSHGILLTVSGLLRGCRKCASSYILMYIESIIYGRGYYFFICSQQFLLHNTAYE